MINESVIDAIQEKRCSELFNDNDEFKDGIVGKILTPIFKWLDNQGLDFDKTVENVRIEGSSIGFQYTETSDIDVSVFTTIPKEKIDNELYKILPNGNNLEGTKHPINYYLSKKDENQTAENMIEIYNRKEHKCFKWIKKQDLKDVKPVVPISYIGEIAKFFINGVENRIAEYECDKFELESLKKQPKTEENDKLITNKELEVKADLDSIYVAHCMLHGFRISAFPDKENDKKLGDYPLLMFQEEDGKKDPVHSVNNLIYKYIEEIGLFEKLDKYEKIREEYK